VWGYREGVRRYGEVGGVEGARRGGVGERGV